MKTPFFSLALRRHLASLLAFAGFGITSLALADTPSPRSKVCLALSGGGARGIAHIGVLKALEEKHIPIDCITGTSMGAIVGGLYAAGYSADELAKIIKDINWSEQFDDRPARQALTQSQKEDDFGFTTSIEVGFGEGKFHAPKGTVGDVGFERMLAQLTTRVSAIDNFDHFPIPFRAVATDLATGEKVVFDHGNLARALRASMSIPGAFAPIEVEGRLMGDGGLVDNLPIDVARDMGADIVIAVNIGTHLADRSSLTDVFAVTRQMITILGSQNVQAQLANLRTQDILITPQLGKLSSLDFPNALKSMDPGYQAAQTAMPRLLPLALAANVWPDYLAQRHQPRALGGQLDFVRVSGSQRSNPQALLRSISSNPGTDASAARLQADATTLMGSGDFERVDYNLVQEGDRLGAVFAIEEKSWGPNFLRFGLGGSTDFRGNAGFDVLLGHRLNWLNDWGGEWRNRLQIGRTRAIHSELRQPLGEGAKFFFAPRLDLERRTLDVYEGDRRIAQWQGGFDRVGLDLGWPITLSGSNGSEGVLGEFRIGLISGKFTAEQQVGASITAPFELTENGIRTSLVMDQLDNATFPRTGWRVAANTLTSRTAQGSNADYTRWNLATQTANSAGRGTWLSGLELGGFRNASESGFSDFRLGGFQRLSGYQTDQLAGNYYLLGKVGYRYRLAEITPFGRALYAGGSLEFGNIWAERSQVSTGDLHKASSVYIAADTPIGPVYLGLGLAGTGHRTVYLFLGKP